MKKQSIYNYNSCINLLLGEIKKYYQNQERKSKKRKKKDEPSKMTKFINYIQSINGTFSGSKIQFLWNKNKLSKNFIASLNNYSFDDIIPKVIEILCGNFTKAKKKYISDKNKKPVIFYLLPLNNLNNILFSICIRKDINNKSLGYEYIYFLSICEENQNKKYFENFINKITSEEKNDKFPEVPFDKIGLYSNHNMFFENIKKDEITNIEICFPVKKIELYHEIIFDKIVQNKNIIELKNNSEDFKSNILNNSIIEEIENSKIEDIILDMIDNNEIFNLNLSNQEKELVKLMAPAILSGRPGTGKTTVTLIKLLVIYYNFLIKKCKRENNCIDYKYINDNYIKINKGEINNKLITKNLRIVFTSLSKYLCEEEQKIFGQFIYKSSELNFNFTSKDDYLEMHSFRDVKSYPLFINFRKLIFMIDGSITFQFFQRQNLSNSLVKNLSDEIIYNKNSDYLCNNYEIFHLDRNLKDNNISFFYSLPKLLYEVKNNKKNNGIKLKESNEVTFVEFYNSFLMGNKNNELKMKLKKLALNPIEIYSQLYSIIKGSITSHLYSNNCLNKEDYKSKGRKLSDLPDLDTIYDICLEYENFKKDKFFDMQDVVNHLIRQIKIEFKNDIKLIDYLFIDEVQDLTINQIYLLSLISKNVKIYGGDTCQTISKINRFRFSDLKTIFYGFSKIIKGYKQVKNSYVSLNFRLNSKILRLSNFFAYLLRDMFPNTLDKVQDDFSIKVTEFYPFYVGEIKDLEKALAKKLIQNDKILIDGVWRNINPNDLNLFKYHSFICRDDNTKDILEKKNLNSYTIMECKGLEKHFIIVYNFFTSSKFNKEWNMIFSNIVESEKYEQVRQKNILNLEQNLYQENILKLINKLNISYNTDDKNKIREKILNEIKTYIYPEMKSPFDKHELFEFCSEIKQFYVIITRAQTFLMFFESEPDFFDKFYFYRFCTEKHLIVDKRFIEGNVIIKQINDYFKKNKISVLSVDQFREDALNEYYKNNFSNALYFFEQIGELKWIKKCKIFLDYEKLENLNNNNLINEKMILVLSNKILSNINELFKEGEKDSIYYIIMAFCYKLQKKYSEAIAIYEKYKKYKECGNIYYEKGEYQKALKYFLLSEDDYYVVDCYSKLKDFEEMFKYANTNYKRLKRYTYTKIYQDYTYEFFFNLLPKDNVQKTNITLKNKISVFFQEYTKIINLFENLENDKKRHEKVNNIVNIHSNLYSDIYLDNYNNSFYNIKEAIKDLNLLKPNDIVSTFINAYYFNLKGSIYKEIIRLIPDIFILKSEIKINKEIKNIEKKIIKNLENIYKNSELSLERKYYISIPLFIFNNFYNLAFNYNKNKDDFSFDDMLLFYLTINEKNKVEDMMKSVYCFPKYTNDYYNYFILRQLSNSLIISLNNLGAYNNYYYNDFKESKNKFLKYIKKMKISSCDEEILLALLKEIENNNIYFLVDKLKEIIKYLNEKIDYKNEFSFSCLALTISLINNILSEKNIYSNEKDITYFLNEIFREFYTFIFSVLNIKDIWKKPYLKKLLIYLLTPFGITPIPSQTKLFSLYNNIPCFVINKNSFIFFKEIKEKNIFDNKIYDNIKYFDSELNNYIISYDDAMNLFRNLVSSFMLKCYYEQYDYIDYPLIFIMNDEFNSKYDDIKKKDIPLYFNLIFYINTISQKYKGKIFDTQYIINIGKNTINNNVLIDYKKSSFAFDIDHYLLSLFYYDINEKDVLFKTYLKYFEGIKGNKDFMGKTFALCLLFAEIFKSFNYFQKISFIYEITNKEDMKKKVNIINIFEYFSNKDKNKFYLKENNTIFNFNKKNEDTFIKPSLMTSIILLKRAFPYVLIFMNEIYNLDNIKIYDFNNKLIDYNSLEEISYYDDEKDDYFYDDDVCKQYKLEFIKNFYNLLNYTLDEIVLASNKNQCVYDFSKDMEFERIEKDKELQKLYDFKEFEKEINEKVKNKLKNSIINLHLEKNYLNCFSNKNEWLLVKYLKRKIIESIYKKKEVNKYNDSSFSDDDFDESFEIVNEKEKNELQILDKKKIEAKAIELVNKLSINWNFTFIEYNLFLIYISLNEFKEKIIKKFGYLYEKAEKDKLINITSELNKFISEYKERDFFYLLKEFVLKYYDNNIKSPEQKFVWISNSNLKKITFIEPEIQIEINKINLINKNISEIYRDKPSNNFYPTCAIKGIVYEEIPKEIHSFIFSNYSERNKEKYFNDFNYIYNHILILEE